MRALTNLLVICLGQVKESEEEEATYPEESMENIGDI